MHNKDKHNLFSKEEFFKLLDENKSLPADADEFDREAMEGLTLVKDRAKLEKLDGAIDAILKNEHAKASRRRNIYYFSAAASLLLIVGLFFLIKQNTLNEKNLAENTAPVQVTDMTQAEPPATGTSTEEASKPSEESNAREKKMPPSEQKEVTALEGKLAEQNAKSEAFASDVTVVKETAMDQLSKGDRSTATGGSVAQYDQNAAGGKGDVVYRNERELNIQTRNNENQNGLTKAEEKKLAYKDKEADDKDKSRVVVNTVWTSPAGTSGKDEQSTLKQQQAAPESKPATVVDSRSAPQTSSATTQPVQSGEEMQIAANDQENQKMNGPAKNAELAKESKNKSRSGHAEAKKANSKAPAAADGDNAGYAYYAQSGARDFQSPQFIGGEAALNQFLRDNLAISVPDKKGTVTIEFTVKSNGGVDTSGARVISGIKNCQSCSDDVIRMISKMPSWQPATENGKAKEYRQKLSVPYNANTVKK